MSDSASSDPLSLAIDHLYGVHENPAHWAPLVDSMLTLLATLEAPPGDDATADADQRLLAWLLPHISRVLQQQRQLAEQQDLLDFQSLVLDRHALAIALCDVNANVVWANSAMRQHLAQLSGASLSRLVGLQAQRPQSHLLRTPAGDVAFVALDAPSLGPTYVALLASAPDSLYLDGPLLKTLFKLTDAEIGVAQRVATGLAPDDIARLNGVSIHTVRAQLKSVMGKLGTQRQSELAARLLGSPAVLPSAGPVRR